MVSKGRRHLSLDYVPDTPDEKIEPLTFGVRDQTFTCIDEVPAAIALKLGRIQDPDIPEWEKMKTIDAFVQSVVIADDRHRWSEMLEKTSPAIGMDELMFYIKEIAEALGDRPTEGQSASPTSLSETLPTSTGDSSAVVEEPESETPSTSEASSI